MRMYGQALLRTRRGGVHTPVCRFKAAYVVELRDGNPDGSHRERQPSGGKIKYASHVLIRYGKEEGIYL
jgi:hypothetical protein